MLWVIVSWFLRAMLVAFLLDLVLGVVARGHAYNKAEPTLAFLLWLAWVAYAIRSHRRRLRLKAAMSAAVVSAREPGMAQRPALVVPTMTRASEVVAAPIPVSATTRAAGAPKPSRSLGLRRPKAPLRP